MFERLFKSALCLMILICLLTLNCGRTNRGNSSKGVTEGQITITGSETLLPLTTAWANSYQKQYPNVRISVSGGGSGQGIMDLINGQNDIATTSRNIKPDEKRQIESKGLIVKEIPVALDCIAVIINPKNPLNELTIEQLGQIFTGRAFPDKNDSDGVKVARNWLEFGGSDREIRVITRENSSGTYKYFQEAVMNKKDYRVDSMPLNNPDAIITEVAGNECAIGYVGLAFARSVGDRVKIIAVKKDINAIAVLPVEDTVFNGSYPISRYLTFVTTEAKYQGDLRAFVEWCIGPQGQQLCADNDQLALNKR